jgi:uncharacterized membrane protein
MLLRVFLALASSVATLMLGQAIAEAGRYEYRVTGVMPSDRLNVRERVDDQDKISATKILGQIPANGRGILGSGATQRVGNTRWFEVRYGEVRGWVNGRFLAPLSPKIGRELESDLFCSGTEPFWSLKVENTVAELRQPDEQPERVSVLVREPFQGREDALALRLADDGGPELSALIQNKEWCNDGMSDLEYAFEVHILGLRGHDQPLRGCCSLLR